MTTLCTQHNTCCQDKKCNNEDMYNAHSVQQCHQLPSSLQQQDAKWQINRQALLIIRTVELLKVTHFYQLKSSTLKFSN